MPPARHPVNPVCRPWPVIAYQIVIADRDFVDVLDGARRPRRPISGMSGTARPERDSPRSRTSLMADQGNSLATWPGGLASTPTATSPSATIAASTTSASDERRARRPILMLIADLDTHVIHATTGELLRHLTLDPTRNYQPTGRPPGQPPRKTTTARTPMRVQAVRDVSQHHIVELGGIEPPSVEWMTTALRPFPWTTAQRLPYRRVGWPPRGPPPGLSPGSAVFHAVSGLSRCQPSLLLPGCGGQAPRAIAGRDRSRIT